MPVTSCHLSIARDGRLAVVLRSVQPGVLGGGGLLSHRHGRPDSLAIIILDLEHLLGDDERDLRGATLALDFGSELDARSRTEQNVGVVGLNASLAGLVFDSTPGLAFARDALGRLVEGFADFAGQRYSANHEACEPPEVHHVLLPTVVVVPGATRRRRPLAQFMLLRLALLVRARRREACRPALGLPSVLADLLDPRNRLPGFEEIENPADPSDAVSGVLRPCLPG